MKKITTITLMLILSAVLISSTEIKITKADDTDIYIRADGSIEGTDKIQRDGNLYTFIDDIYSRIEIQRSNIILDGAGYSIIKSEKDFAIVVGTSLEVPEPVGANGITIKNLQIIGFNYGITLGGENNLVQKVNITDSQDYNGIAIWVSGSNHRIQECRITDNKGFGMLIHATDTLISDNYIANNGNFGIQFYDHNATFRNNIFDNNWGGPFQIPERSMENPGEPLAISSDNIDSSNTVDGKPIYYWVNESDKTVPSEAGYIYLDNCRNIEVNNLAINRNSTGRFFHGSTAINLIRTENSTILRCSLNGTGIYISWSSQNIIVSNNQITSAGVHSWGSNIVIVENSISSINDIGISLGGSSNEVAWNNLTRCKTGPLETYYQSYNNTWDCNYWSDYEGTDLDGDGLGDMPYIINDDHQDNHPLVESIIIPEFHSWIILPLFLIATFSVIVVRKRLAKSS
ncbi:MAG: right-handed parallel beta-helix repeat-containing protein [Candidatus Bathyarchaeota archaeon]